MNTQIKIPGDSAVRTGFAASRNAQPLALRHARGNLDLIRFGLDDLAAAAANRTNLPVFFAGAFAILANDPAPQRNRPHGAAHRFLERDHDFTFNVAATLGHVFLGCESSALSETAAAATHPRTEQLLKKIAEAGGAAELKFVISPLPRLAAAGRTAPAILLLPARRRTQFRASFPIRAQLIVFFPLG